MKKGDPNEHGLRWRWV